MRILSDHGWHDTAELARRVGHTFGHAKYEAILLGVPIEREPHPRKPNQFRYRVLHPAEVKAAAALRRRYGSPK
ncbi:MAG: hypothetical protein HYV07_07735 [Deltaproteobacteria bacterium]|nr:hypothetical protein [Deltaproteobacteria bacterium]